MVELPSAAFVDFADDDEGGGDEVVLRSVADTVRIVMVTGVTFLNVDVPSRLSYLRYMESLYIGLCGLCFARRPNWCLHFDPPQASSPSMSTSISG